jgi:hypothetical protein
MEKEIIDAIKLLELFKASNFSSSGRASAEGRSRINKAIVEIRCLVKENEEYKRQAARRSEVVKWKLERMLEKEKIEADDTSCEKCESFEKDLCCRKADGSCDMFEAKISND